VDPEIGCWREPDGSIHMTIKGMPNGHVAVNADPSKPNGHPTLYARLDRLLRDTPLAVPREIIVQFVSPDGAIKKAPDSKYLVEISTLPAARVCSSRRQEGNLWTPSAAGSMASVLLGFEERRR
jgi:hypothetical protein